MSRRRPGAGSRAPWARLAAVLAAAGALLFRASPSPGQGMRVTPAPLYSAAEEADLDRRLHDEIDSLSFDHARGVYRSRHGRRAETFAETIPYLERRLSLQSLPATAFLDPGSPSRLATEGLRDCFHWNVNDSLSLEVCNTGVTLLPRRRPVGGKLPRVILCSHYDSDGRLTGKGWHYETDPAPGADDAASGCAAVLELEREVSTLDLPFAVEFRLFGGEEFGLFGSRHEAPLARARGDSILAVINFDQLAYAPRGDSLFVVTDAASGWLADSLVAVSRRAWRDGPALVKVVEASPEQDSDHYPYLEQGYPAAMLVEAPEPVYYNKTTETVGDTLGNLSMRAIRRAVQLVGHWLRELAEPRLRLESRPFPGSECGRVDPALAWTDSVELAPSVLRVTAGGPRQRFVEAREWITRDPADLGANPRLCDPSWWTGARVPVPLAVYGEDAPFPLGARVELPARRLGVPAWAVGTRYVAEAWSASPDTGAGQAVAGWSVGGEFGGRGAEPWDLGGRGNPAGSAWWRLPSESVTLPAGTAVTVEVFDVRGARVRRAVERVQAQSFGTRFVSLLRPDDPAATRPGIYYFRLTLADGRVSRGRFALVG